MSGTYYSSLQNLYAELELTRLSIKQTQQQVDTLRSQIKKSSASDSFSVSSQEESSLKTRYDDRIRNLEEELDKLQLRFTDKHPDVVEARQLLQSLEDYRKKEIDAFLASVDEEDQLPLNELTQEIRLEMSKLQGEVASLKVKESDLETKIAEFESKVDLIPQIEAESTALNRDYGITKKKYEELLSRRESADLSRRAEVSSEELQFRIIEPPLVANTPSGPNRLILYTAVLLVGFGTGVGLALLLSQLSPVLIRPKQLSSLSEYPIWGTVSHLDIEQIKRKNRTRVFIFACSCMIILGLYCILVAAETMNVNLVTRYL